MNNSFQLLENTWCNTFNWWKIYKYILLGEIYMITNKVSWSNVERPGMLLFNYGGSRYFSRKNSNMFSPSIQFGHPFRQREFQKPGINHFTANLTELLVKRKRRGGGLESSDTAWIVYVARGWERLNWGLSSAEGLYPSTVPEGPFVSHRQLG